MNKKKLSPAQQALLAAIAGKTLTYRIVSLWRGGVTTRSLFDVRIEGEKTEIKVRLSTIDALTATGDVILTCVDHGNKAYTVALPAPEAPEAAEAQEAEASATPEAPEVEAALDFDQLKASWKKLKEERREIAKQDTSEEVEKKICSINMRRWFLFGRMAEALIAYPANEIKNAGFAYHVIDIISLTSRSQAERDYWEGEKTRWAQEIRRRRKAEATTAHEVEAPEAETPKSAEVEVPAPAPEAPAHEAAGTETRVWPEKGEMSKYGYCISEIRGNREYKEGHVYYEVLDYKPAALVGSYSPGFVCRASILEEAIATAEALERIDMSLSRAWRACKIRMARKGLRKSKGVEHNTPAPTTPTKKVTWKELTEARKAWAAREALVARAKEAEGRKAWAEAKEAWDAAQAKEAEAQALEVETPEVEATPEAPELKTAAREEEIGLFHSLIKEGQYVLAEAVVRQQIATAMTAMRSKYAVEAALRQAEITANDAAALAAPAERDEDWRLNAQKEAEAWEAKTLASLEREPECKWAKKAYSRAKVEAEAATEVAAERVAVADAARAKVEEAEAAAAVARAAAEETAVLAAGLNVHMQNLSTCLLMQGKTAEAKKVDYDLNALQKKQDELQDWILQFISAPSY